MNEPERDVQDAADRAKAGRRMPRAPRPMCQWNGEGGLAIAGDSWGDAEALPVVLMHGGGQTRHAWGRTGAVLAENGYRALAYDARGHGDSDWSAEVEYDFPVFARDLARVVAQTGAARPVLVGASLGGLTSLIAIGRGLVDARALVLVDIVHKPDMRGADRILSFMQAAPDGYASLEDVAEAIGRYRPENPRRPRPEGLQKNLRVGDDGRYRWHWDPRFLNPEQDREALFALLADCARRVNVPTVLIRGCRSDVVTDETVAEFLTLCPHAKQITVGQAGHMVAGDRNDAFGDAILGFLRRTVPAAGA